MYLIYFQLCFAQRGPIFQGQVHHTNMARQKLEGYIANKYPRKKQQCILGQFDKVFNSSTFVENGFYYVMRSTQPVSKAMNLSRVNGVVDSLGPRGVLAEEIKARSAYKNAYEEAEKQNYSQASVNKLIEKRNEYYEWLMAADILDLKQNPKVEDRLTYQSNGKIRLAEVEISEEERITGKEFFFFAGVGILTFPVGLFALAYGIAQNFGTLKMVMISDPNDPKNNIWANTFGNPTYLQGLRDTLILTGIFLAGLTTFCGAQVSTKVRNLKRHERLKFRDLPFSRTLSFVNEEIEIRRSLIIKLGQKGEGSRIRPIEQIIRKGEARFQQHPMYGLYSHYNQAMQRDFLVHHDGVCRIIEDIIN